MKSLVPPRVFSAAQIGFAACVGGPLAGAWLLAQSAKVLKLDIRTSDIWWTAAVLTAFLLMLIAVLPLHALHVVSGLPALLSGLFCMLWAHRIEGKIYASYRAAGNPPSSWWHAILGGVVMGILCWSALGAITYVVELCQHLAK